MIKLRLHTDTFDLSGYDNIQINSLDSLKSLEIYDAGEIDELIVEHILETLPLEKMEESLTMLAKLVKRGGTLVISGTDTYEISKALANFNIDIKEFNKQLFGTEELPKRCGLTIFAICNFISNHLGMKILKKRVNGPIYAVEATR